MDLTAEAAPRPPEIPTGQFFREVFGIYHRHFWLLMKFLVPATIFGYLAVMIAGDKAREIMQRVPLGPAILEHKVELLESFSIRLVGYMLSCVVYCFAFAGISIAVRDIESGTQPVVEDSLDRVRSRPSAFLGVSLVLYALLVVAGLLGFRIFTFILEILWKWGTRPSPAATYAGQAIYLLLLLVVSRFGLALPAVVLDDCKVLQSLFRSDELTSGRLRILVGLLLKSVGGSYIMAIAPFWIAGHVFGQNLLNIWEWWVLTALSFLGVLLVEPTMFIGLALLYVKSTQSAPEPFKTAPAI